MSHYTTVKTKLVDQAALIAALQHEFAEIEVHDQPQALIGYQGDVRPQRAHVIVRRTFISGVSNDIGFVRQEDGTYQAIISEFDERNGYGTAWLQRLTQRYSYHCAVSQLEQQGYTLAEEHVESGTIRLTMRRVVA
jgi:hypothetical protein